MSMIIHDLLPELCNLIFAHCLYVECGRACLGDERACAAPLVLTHVCKRWRAMVIANPRLWTRIHVRPMTLDIFRAPLWLLRAAALPVRVTICTLPLRGWNTSAIVSAVVPYLVREFLPHLPRIAALRTTLAAAALPLLFPPDAVTHMPHADTLTLLVEDTPADEGPALGLLRAPRMHALHVRDITPLRDALPLVLPLLRTLVVQPAPAWYRAEHFPDMLSSCARLETCSISFPSENYDVNLVAPIDLPELQDLSLEWSAPFVPNAILAALRAPKLHTLSVAVVTQNQCSSLSILASFIQSASASLTSLTFTGVNPLSEADTAALLRRCPALERLALNNCQRAAENFLVPLTPPPCAPTSKTAATNTTTTTTTTTGTRSTHDADAWPCPRLTHIALSGLHTDDARPVVNFARARVCAEAPALHEQLARQLQLQSQPQPMSMVKQPAGDARPACGCCSPCAVQQHGEHDELAERCQDQHQHQHRRHLRELRLDGDISALPRPARVLLLSGLGGVLRAPRAPAYAFEVVGPVGELLRGAAAGA